jgi:alkaline phosphatase D
MYMRKLLSFLPVFVLMQVSAQNPITKIGFGSCIGQDNPQEVWYKVDALKPDVFVFLGDNLYGDTKDMALLRAKYEKLFSKPGLKQMKGNGTKVLGVWDDHDYGVNDGGKEYPKKEESKNIFLEFFDEPVKSERRNHPGIYHHLVVGPEGKRVQFIMLDTRTFRDKLCLARIPNDCKGEYRKCLLKSKSMLGEEQWAWLEKILQIPAEVRIVCSSTQFLVDFNGWEAWVNLPHERERFMNLIEKTGANGLFFISGDVHYAELSRLDRPNLYPLYDLTSSGMTHGNPCAGGNKNRVGEAYLKPNFGFININWNKAVPEISMEIRDEANEVKISRLISLDEISIKNPKSN